MRLFIRLICLLGAVVPPAVAQDVWSVSLEGPLAATPLVAELQGTSGLETLAVQANGTVRALRADGQTLWSAPLGAEVAVGMQACVVPAGEGLSALAVVATAGGAVVGIDAATGEVAWRVETLLEPGLAWCVSADLDDDRIPEVVVVSAAGTAVALGSADGALRWRAERLGTVAGSPCIGDVDADFQPETFVATDLDLISLDAKGVERFRGALETGAVGAPVLGDLDDDARFEVYLPVAPGVVEARNVDDGALLWRTALADERGAIRLAIADLDQDEQSELVVRGLRTHVVSREGKALFRADVQATGLAVGDADGDGEMEVLGLAEGALVLLDAALSTKARVALPGAAQGELTLAAIGGAAVLYAGEGNTLRVVRTGARLMPQLAPWPQPRRDATGRAASLSAINEADLLREGAQLAVSNEPLSLTTGWETQAEVDSWHGDQGAKLALTTDKKIVGATSLQAAPGGADGQSRVVSAALDLAPTLRTVGATVLSESSGTTTAALRWTRSTGEVVEHALKPADKTAEGWQRFRISNFPKPAGAVKLAVVLSATDATGAPVHWDDLQVTGKYLAVPSVEVFGNQLGYEQFGPKRFTAATTFTASEGKFRVLSEAGAVAFEGALDTPQRVVGAYGSDWGKYFWQGDFSALEEAGRFRIEVSIGGDTAQTGLFDLAPDLLWTRVFEAAVSSLKGMRCEGGCAEAGCLWRGSSVEDCAESLALVRTLADTYNMTRWRYAARVGEQAQAPPIEEELRWAGDRLLQQAEAALAGGSAQQAALASALSSVALALPEQTRYLDAARKLFDAAAADTAAASDATIQRSLYLAAVDLAAATGDEAMIAAAKTRYLGPDIELAETTARYDGSVDDMSGGSFQLGAMLSAQADALLARAANPFGVAVNQVGETPNYFLTPPAGSAKVPAGNSRFLLDAARSVATAYRYATKPEYTRFAVDQINWLLGNNPLGVSLVEGLGTRPLPRYAWGDAQSSARPPMGSVAHGTRGQAPGKDVPTLDLGTTVPPDALSNAVSPGDSVRLAETIARLKRIRFAARP